MEQIKEKLLLLKDLDESLKNCFKSLSSNKEDGWEAFWEQAVNIVQLKKEIENEFSKTGIFIVGNKDAELMLQKINSKQLLFADLVIRSFEQTTKTKLDLETRDWNELYEIASNELFSWFGPTEYIERLIEIGALVLGINIPKELESIVEEARRCYAFEQYIAVYSLCRTILESAMRDICLRIGKIEKIEDTKIFYEKYRPKILIKFVSNGDSELKERVKKLYYERLSAIVHGLKLSDTNGVQSAFKETIIMVQELYQKNQNRLLDGKQ
ncbi:MAG: hypothetical protein ACREOI_09090 [bacterium]